METGYDILFFWVARMIMMGIENTGEVPFQICLSARPDPR
jgi:valyl-tRNA synthetase